MENLLRRVAEINNPDISTLAFMASKYAQRGNTIRAAYYLGMIAEATEDKVLAQFITIFIDSKESEY